MVVIDMRCAVAETLEQAVIKEFFRQRRAMPRSLIPIANLVGFGDLAPTPFPGAFCCT